MEKKEKKENKTSQAQINAVRKYAKKHYERINLQVKKGERKRYRQAADKLGLSLNALFIKAVEEYIKLSENSDNSVAKNDK